MQVSIDIRWYDFSCPYGRFVITTVCSLAKANTEINYRLYSSSSLSCETPENTKTIIVKQKKTSIFEQNSFKKILEKDGSNLYLFFDEKIPFKFSKEYMVFISSLKEIFFPKLGFIEKFFYQKYISNSLRNSQKVICFESNTALELNERLNVPENKIEIIYPFFFSERPHIDIADIKLDIKAKYNLSHDYILYDAGNDTNSNFERVLSIFEKLMHKWIPANLLVLCEDTTRDIQFRQKVLDLKIEKSVFFIGAVDSKEESYYYEQAGGIIFPSIYTSFPFEFSKAILYKVPILANELKSTQEIMWDAITYFNSHSWNDATKQVETFLKKQNPKRNYEGVEKILNPQNTVQKLQEIISNWGE